MQDKCQCVILQKSIFRKRKYYSSAEHSDVEKLGSIAGRLQDPDKVLQFLSAAIEQIEADRDTRELLVTILDDERATIKWVLESWELLRPEAGK
jgi:uncharacterized protein (DUF2225 family)